jgi:hypothetical protein
MSSKKIFSYEEEKSIGEKLGIKWDKFDFEQFNEFPDHYDKSENMEMKNIGKVKNRGGNGYRFAYRDSEYQGS